MFCMLAFFLDSHHIRVLAHMQVDGKTLLSQTKKDIESFLINDKFAPVILKFIAECKAQNPRPVSAGVRRIKSSGPLVVRVASPNGTSSTGNLKTLGFGTCSVDGHSNKPHDFYCEQEGCKKLICSLCFLNDHKQHAVTDPQDVVDRERHEILEKKNVIGLRLQKAEDCLGVGQAGVKVECILFL
jgi:hypothetical protein